MPPSNSKTSVCLSKVRKFDHFGGTLSLSLNNEESYKTVLGAFCTMTFYTVMALAAAIYIQQFLDNSSPTVQYNKLKATDFLDANLVANKMEPFLLVNTRDRYLDFNRARQIYRFDIFKIKSSDSIGDGGIIVKNVTRNLSVSMMPCYESEFLGKDKKLEQLIPADSLKLIRNYGLCFNTSEITVSGGLSSDLKDQFVIQVNPCNPTQTFGCEVDETLKSRITNWTTITIGFIESEYDLKNQIDPVIYRFNDQTYSSLETVKLKKMELSIKKTELIDMQGRVYPVAVESMALSVGYVLRDDRQRNYDNDPYLSILVKSSNEMESYTRSYMNFMDLCGLLGGLFGSVSATIFFAYSAYNSMFMSKEMITTSIFQGSENELPDKYRVKNFVKTKMMAKLGMKPKNKAQEDGKIDDFSLLETYEEISSQMIDLASLAKGQSQSSVICNALLDENHRMLLPILLVNNKLKVSDKQTNVSQLSQVVPLHSDNRHNEKPKNFVAAYNNLRRRADQHGGSQNLILQHIDAYFLENIELTDLVCTKDSLGYNYEAADAKDVTLMNQKSADTFIIEQKRTPSEVIGFVRNPRMLVTHQIAPS